MLGIGKATKWAFMWPPRDFPLEKVLEQSLHLGLSMNGQQGIMEIVQPLTGKKTQGTTEIAPYSSLSFSLGVKELSSYKE